MLYLELTDLFQSSLDQEVLTGKWKEANVYGVFKKGKREDCKSYIPISLTCFCCKIMKHIVHSHIMKHLETIDILVNNQHGFR